MQLTHHRNLAARIPRVFPFIVIFIFLTLLTGSTISQDLNKKISIHVKNESLTEILAKIGKLGNINFSYNPEIIPAGSVFSLKATNKPVREILDQILPEYGISWTILESQVVLRLSGKQEPAAATSEGSRHRYTISGHVREKSTGENLIGANIYITGTSTGTTTNGYGFYSLTLPSGVYEMVIKFLGFKPVVKEIRLEGEMNVPVEMEEVQMTMKEVEVTSHDNPESMGRQLSNFTLTRQTLSQLPGFAGAMDIIRSLQVIPGIRSFGDGSSFYYVRGGNWDQNLLMIDEAPVYNPSHLFGFFSALSPEAINDIQVYKGDFPAQYGGRLSSVIDVKGREGNMKHFSASGNLGPLASSLSVEGPIARERASFFLSGRLSTLNWLNYFIPGKETFNLWFYDINAKVNFILNKTNRFFITFYTGKDDFVRLNQSYYSTYGISWNNLAGSFRWNHIFSNKLFSTTTISLGRYKYFLDISQDKKDNWHSSISNLTLKTDFTWYLNPKNTLRSGLEVTSHYSDPGNVSLGDTSSHLFAPEVSKYHSIEYVLYLSNDQILWNKLNLRYGIRLPVWEDVGPAKVYYFDANHEVIDTSVIKNLTGYSTYFSPEPRISLLWQVKDGSILKAGYTRNSQFIQVLSNSTGPFTSLEVWAPSGPNIKPQVADQYSTGYFQSLFKSRINLSAEAYYKIYSNYIDYKDHANMLYNPLIEGELRFGKAWSYGLELMIRKPEGKLTGWISYTWSRTWVRTAEVNHGNKYPASYDCPHDFCINISYDTKKHWSFTGTWYYLTGGTITTPIGFYYQNGYSVPIYGDKNNSRLPDYHRLDLSVTYRFSNPENHFQHLLALTLYNAYGRMNPYSVSFNRFMDDTGDLVVPSNLSGGYQLVPTSISVAGIIPSINYKFRF